MNHSFIAGPFILIAEVLHPNQKTGGSNLQLLARKFAAAAPRLHSLSTSTRLLSWQWQSLMGRTVSLMAGGAGDHKDKHMLIGSLEPWRTDTDNLLTSPHTLSLTHTNPQITWARKANICKRTERSICIHKKTPALLVLYSLLHKGQTQVHVDAHPIHTQCKNSVSLSLTHTHTDIERNSHPASNVLCYSWGRKHSNNHELLLAVPNTFFVVYAPTEREWAKFQHCLSE